MPKIVMPDGTIVEQIFEVDGVFYGSVVEFDRACDEFNARCPELRIEYKEKLAAAVQALDSTDIPQDFFLGGPHHAIGYRRIN